MSFLVWYALSQGSLIDSYCWFHLFLNYLYLVALLNLKVSYAFMFCSLWRTSWKPFVCFSLWFEHTLTFIVSLSWSFVCVHLHVYNMVAKFLAVMIISFMPMFKFYWSQLINAYIFDQDCVGACHLKNYSFVITYLLEDEQELSLGMLDTSQTYL